MAKPIGRKRPREQANPVARVAQSRRAAAFVPDYPEIDLLGVLDALPDGSIVMMDPDTTTYPVLWCRVGAYWVKTDPLDGAGERDRITSLALFQRRIAAARIRKLVLVWTMPNR